MPPENPTCAHCGEDIKPGERGPATGEPVHRECLIRLIVGSISHQLGKCRCYGGDWEDPPELSVREAARLAVEYWNEQNP